MSGTSADVWINVGRLMNQFDRAAQQYFDPADPKPVCDICEEPWDRPDDPEPWVDWHDETGCHYTCEERQIDEEDGLVLIAGVLYDAETLEEAEQEESE